MTWIFRTVGTEINPNHRISAEGFHEIRYIESIDEQNNLVIKESQDDVGQLCDLARRFFKVDGSPQRFGRTVYIPIVQEVENDYIGEMFSPRDLSVAEKVIRSLDIPKSTVEVVIGAIHEAKRQIREPFEDKRREVPSWKARSGNDKKLSPPEFMSKYYSNEIENGTLTQAFVRNVDKSLYWAFHNWRRLDGNKEVDIGFPLPSVHHGKEGQRQAALAGPWQDLVATTGRHPQVELARDQAFARSKPTARGDINKM